VTQNLAQTTIRVSFDAIVTAALFAVTISHSHPVALSPRFHFVHYALQCLDRMGRCPLTRCTACAWPYKQCGQLAYTSCGEVAEVPLVLRQISVKNRYHFASYIQQLAAVIICHFRCSSAGCTGQCRQYVHKRCCMPDSCKSTLSLFACSCAIVVA
jgi:hypothetical protein